MCVLSPAQKKGRNSKEEKDRHKAEESEIKKKLNKTSQFTESSPAAHSLSFPAVNPAQY
jgi:hypothetical protein